MLRIIAVLIVLHLSCLTLQAQTLILVSKFNPKGTYQNWLRHVEPGVRLVNMYELPKDSMGHYLRLANGILITGGEDVHPAQYGKPDARSRCGDVDARRDTLEMQLIDYALRTHMPLLGICRGEQIINVTTGGSLIIDIPADVGLKVKHRDTIDVKHQVTIYRKSQLYAVTKTDTGHVISAHHQAIERLGNGLNKVATATDGIIEAVESANWKQHFALGVQWHPERMDWSHPLSGPIAERFLLEANKYNRPSTKKGIVR